MIDKRICGVAAVVMMLSGCQKDGVRRTAQRF